MVDKRVEVTAVKKKGNILIIDFMELKVYFNLKFIFYDECRK